VSVEMKLGRWQARDGSVHTVRAHFPSRFYPWLGEADWEAWSDTGRYSASVNPNDLVHYLGPIELSPTPACADQAGTLVVSPVSTETAGEQLQRMRQRYNAMDREASIYSGLLAALDQAKSDLDERIRAMEKEHDL